MTFHGDPFRVLGLHPGATEEQIKRAYRQLAKRYHPDSAGETALPRFLAIQAAYDMLTGPTRDSRAGARPASPTAAGGPTPPAGRPSDARASEADTDRARATRDAYRARRARTGAAGGAAGPAGSSWARDGRPGAPPRTGGSADPGSTATGGDRGPSTGSPGRNSPGGEAAPGTRPPSEPRRRPRKVATLGSTSYDDAPRDPEPEWGGATWYGGSSGTYWTINPKEYADPRKHGPEYLARARRAARGDAAAPGEAPDAAASADADEPPLPERDPAAASSIGSTARPRTRADVRFSRAGRAPRPGWSTGGPTTSAGPIGGTEADPRRAPTGPATAAQDAPAGDRRPASAAGPTPFGQDASPGDRRPDPAAAAPPRFTRPATSSAGPTSRVAFDEGPDDDVFAKPFDAALPQRVLLALIAWPPLGYAAGALVGEATGCSRYAAACSNEASAIGWIVQPAIVGLLLLLPIVARPAAIASIAVGIGALLGAAVLSIAGGARDPTHAAPTLFVALIVMAYAVGLIGALSGRIRLPYWLRRTD